ELVLLVRARAAYRGCLVFWRKFKTPMAAQPLARLPGRRCIFYNDVCLAGFVGSSLSKFLAAGVIVSFGCLPWRLLCVLGLVCWPHRARQFPGFVAEFAVSVLSCVRVDRARMGPRVVVRRF